jgi:hypothetical protein
MGVVSKILNELLEKMWVDYCKLNPAARRIFELFSNEGEKVVNDHIALRTFQHPKLGIESLAKGFKSMGYTERASYEFKEKKLFAKHYEHADPLQPKIFISELEIHKMSDLVKSEVERMVQYVGDKELSSPSFSMCGRPWPTSFATYQKLAAESEYASWVNAFGFRPNHFTVNINLLKKFPSVQQVNLFLKSHGYILNSSGGEIKGSPEDLLEQSSTMAENIKVEFTDGIHEIPGCYYEFAKRYAMKDGNLYSGFVAKSADKIFESTNRR